MKSLLIAVLVATLGASSVYAADYDRSSHGQYKRAKLTSQKNGVVKPWTETFWEERYGG